MAGSTEPIGITQVPRAGERPQSPPVISILNSSSGHHELVVASEGVQLKDAARASSVEDASEGCSAQLSPATSIFRQNPGEEVVHSEHDGKLLTVQKDMLGTSFFAKRKFGESADYRDPKNGPQGFCRRFGAVLNHHVEVRRLRPSREFGSYPDWQTALSHLRGQRHLEEVVKEGCPCKPYLDLERDGGLAEGETLETVIATFQDAIGRIFREDYGLELAEEAFNWIPCDYGPGGKFSLHLVVSSHSPQYVYRSNLASPVDPQGAGHLARRLQILLPQRYSELIDQSVYTKNRGIRLPYCSKPATPNSRLIPLDESKPFAASCITWFDDDVQTIPVPSSILDVVQAGRPRSKPEHFRYQSPKTADTYAVQRCTELIQTLHPTAYKRGSGNSLNFSWHDRSEPCYSGHIHPGARDVLCIVLPERNVVLAKCCSERVDSGTGVCCKELPAHYLGELYADCDTWRNGAIEINMHYLKRDPMIAAPMDMWQVASGLRPLTDEVTFKDIVNKWQAGRYKAALIRSPMGSGKSTLLRAIVDEVPRPQSVLYGTYRQTQASDAAGKNRDFSHYNDLKQMRGRLVGDRYIEPIADRELYPRIICQVDSLPRLLLEDVGAPAFDLITLDESESIFAHLSAATFRERQNVIRLMVELLRRARRVICLDGHLGQRTFDFLTLHRISCSPVLINKHAPEQPLEVEFLEGKEGRKLWQDAIFRALADGENVFVVGVSSDKARELGASVAESELVEEREILIVTRHSDGEVKRGLEDVNSSWKKRLVIISPTVEAGVDFNQPWFHQMFLYI